MKPESAEPLAARISWRMSSMYECYKAQNIVMIAMLFFLPSAFADLRFTCTWDNEVPIEIIVDAGQNRAFRSDKGPNYTVIKITKFAVWMAVIDPANPSALKYQMIQRPEMTGGKAGVWQDVVHSITGNVQPILGGMCWEKDAS